MICRANSFSGTLNCLNLDKFPYPTRAQHGLCGGSTPPVGTFGNY